MRMRDLERASGVGRETIRYYIRENLLPEPTRASRNSALYTDEHLTRLRAIKRLQAERYLPLSVIRALVTTDAARWLADASSQDLDLALLARLDESGERRVASEVAAEAYDDPDGLATAVAAGVVEIAADGTVGPRDIRLIRLLGRAGRIGFNRERGYDVPALTRYVAIVRSLAQSEHDEFFARVAPGVSVEQATAMAETGIGITNAILSELHSRELYRLLDARALRQPPPSRE